jgi:phosphoglycolate phosphatase
MIRAIIFDWSGVLSDDLGMCYEVTGKVLKSLGRKIMPLDRFRKEFDLPYMDFFRSLGIKPDKKKIDELYVSIFRKLGRRPELFPYTKRTLRWLDRKGVELALLSSHPRELLMKEIDGNGFSKLFTHVIGGAYDKRKSISGLVDKIGSGNEETVFVGDMKHDIEAGKLAGVLTAAVLSGYHDRETLEGMEPNFIFRDVRDLRFLVEGVYV